MATTFGSTSTLYASFADAALAEKAAGALLDHGARNEDISIVASEPSKEVREEVREDGVYDRTHTTYIDHSTGAGDSTEHAAKQGISTTTAGDATAGAAKGAGIGLGVGVAAALASILIPGFGLVAGGGALATAIAGAVGATAAGAVAGGVHGYLKDQGVPDEVAVDYDRAVKNGGAVMAVAVPTDKLGELEVREILAKYQASNISTFGALQRDIAA